MELSQKQREQLGLMTIQSQPITAKELITPPRNDKDQEDQRTGDSK